MEESKPGMGSVRTHKNVY